MTRTALEGLQRRRNRRPGEKRVACIEPCAAGRAPSTPEPCPISRSRTTTGADLTTPEDLTRDEREAFEGRAAIMEHDANLPRSLAEDLALVEDHRQVTQRAVV